MTVVIASLLVAVALCVRADEPASPNANSPVKTVGDLGDTRKLQFEGLQRFTSAQLRGKLENDLPYQAAARPSAELEQFLRVIEERLFAGFRYCGCPEARVRASSDEPVNAIRVQVEEGRQYRNGQVEVLAPQQVDRAALVRYLTAPVATHEWRIERDGEDLPGPKEGEIVWKSGDPVHYDEASIAALRSAVQRSLAEQGFTQAKFDVQLTASDDAGNVNLRVPIEDGSTPDRISGIEIIGLKRNSREELLQFLHVQKGDALNAALLERVYKQLKESCRFWTYKVSAVLPSENPSQDSLVASVGNVLKIELDEYTEVPPLGKPLADVDEVLRKGGLLLATTAKSHDFVVEASGLQDATGGIKAVRAVIGCDGRASVEALSAAKSAWDVDHALLVTPAALEVYDWRAQEKYVSPLPASMTFSLKIKPTRGEHDEYTTTATVGGMAKSADGNLASGEGPWQIHIAPVAIVHLAHTKEGKRKVSIRSGELTLSDGHVTLRLDAETGRLKELRCSAGTWIKRDFLVGRLEQGAFDKTAASLRANGQSFRNSYDEGHKFASGFDFTLTQIEKQPIVAGTPKLAVYCRIARQLRSSSTLVTLWNRWLELSGEDAATFGVAQADRGREFRIPAATRGKSNDDMEAAIDTGLLGVPAMADLMFARGSWPWTISREACFSLVNQRAGGGQSEATSTMSAGELRRLANSQQLGPLGALAIARGLAELDSTDTRDVSAISKWGMSMLSQEAFLKDVSLATEGDSGFALVCRAAAEQLGKLPAEEQDQIIDLLPEEFQELAARIAKRRQEQPTEPIADTIRATMVEYWDGGLRDLVQSELQAVTTEVAKKSSAGETTVK